MQPKFVFLDVDGTLVDSMDTIHPSTVQAVEQARKNGHKLFISSGRFRGIMPKCLAPLGFTDGVFGAGANVICDGRSIYNRTFSPQVFDKIVSVLLSHGAMTVIESPEREDMLGESWREEYEATKDWILSLGGKLLEQTPKGLTNIGKIVYKSFDCTKKQLQAELGDICSIAAIEFTDGSTGGDIMLPDVNKSVGIAKVLEYYGAHVSQTIAIGDGENDIEMLELCATGIAMGNASDSVKAHADLITERIENDGLYKAFEMCDLL